MKHETAGSGAATRGVIRPTERFQPSPRKGTTLIRGYVRQRAPIQTNWFPPNLLESNGPIITKTRAVLLATDPQGFAGALAAVRDMDMRRTISLISRPTLVIGGQYDTVTLPSHSELIAATVPGAKLAMLPVVHLSNLESQELFTRITLEFLL